MDTNTFKPVSITLTGSMNSVARTCLYCGNGIPSERRDDAKFCKNSHKQLFYKNKDNNEPEFCYEDFPEETVIAESETPTQVAVEVKPEVKIPAQVIPKPVKWPETLANKQRLELRTLRKVTDQLVELLVTYEMKDSLEIPKNEIHAILPSDYRIDNIDEISIGDCTLRLDVNKNKYLISKNRSI
jgi:hypothetical protein